MSERIPFTDKYGYDELKNMVMNIGNYTKRANLSDAEIIELLKITEGLLAGQMTKIEKKNKGGIMKQMEMFNEGGLKDEGGEVDPVSGNDVPIGSSKKEVRDDIPAMLSEGEFVFPADVVRFLGLEFLMNLRQKAKAGLKRMEEMGQMGNSDEATIPDDVPFTIDDLDMEEEKEYNEGGVVYADNGQLINRPPYGVTSQPSQMGQQFNIAPQQVDPNQTMQFTNTGGYGPQFAGQQPMQQQPVSTFQDLLGKSPGTFDEMIEYTNDKGFVQKIPFKDGEPLYPIPDGFYPVGDKPEELEDPRDVLVESAKVSQDKLDDASSPQSRRKAEQERIQSYRNTIKAVMEENKLSASEAIEFIKAGKHKILGIPIPGALFKDFQLYDGVEDETGVARPATFGLEQAAEDVVRTDAPLFADADKTDDASPFVTTEDDVAKVVTGEGVLTDKEQEDKKTSQKTIKDINEFFVDPKTQKMKGSIVSSADDYIKAEQDAIKKQQELARKQLEAAQKAKGIREDERKARREKQIELDKFTAGKIKDMRTTGRVKSGFEQGGLATKKPKKKKAMKRSGLASKK